MGSSFFDVLSFRRDTDAGRALEKGLAQMFSADEARHLAQEAGMEHTRIDVAGGPLAVWKRVLDQAAQEGKLASLLDRVLARNCNSEFRSIVTRVQMWRADASNVADNGDAASDASVNSPPNHASRASPTVAADSSSELSTTEPGALAADRASSNGGAPAETEGRVSAATPSPKRLQLTSWYAVLTLGLCLGGALLFVRCVSAKQSGQLATVPFATDAANAASAGDAPAPERPIVAPIIELTTPAGPPLRGSGDSNDTRSHYRYHQIIAENRGDVDIFDISLRLQLPEPIGGSVYISKAEPVGPTMSFTPEEPSSVVRMQGSDVAWRTRQLDGIDVIEHLHKGIPILTVGPSNDCRHNAYLGHVYGNGCTGVWRLGIDRLPARGRVTIEFETMDSGIAPEYANVWQACAKMGFGKPFDLLFFIYGHFQTQHQNGTKVLADLFIGIGFDPKTRTMYSTKAPPPNELVLIQLSSPHSRDRDGRCFDTR